MKLNYASFEAIFRKYFTYSSELDGLSESMDEFGETDKTTIVLLASVRGVEHEIEDIFTVNNTTLSKFRNGERDINENLKNLVRTCEENYTAEYFENNLMEHIPKHLYPALIQEYKKLIGYDHTISPIRKRELLQVIENKISTHDVSLFLAEVLKYAILQDNSWHENEIINAPHGRNPFFTGRKEELKRIENIFRQKSSVTISGMPGCGKSELALGYAHSLPHEQWTVLFVNADSENGIIDSYRTLLNYLHVTDGDYQNNTDLLISEVRRWSKSEKSVFIFDNIDYSLGEKKRLLQKYLPDDDPSTKIIFTTRNQKPFSDEEVIMLSGLSEKDSADFLMHRSNRTKNKKGAAILAKRLSYYPLALAQAGAYLHEFQGYSFEAYVRKLDQGLEVLESYAYLSEDERSVRATLKITLDSLTSAERDLLFVASYFSEDGMHLDILNRIFYRMYVYKVDEAGKYLPVIEKDENLLFTLAKRLLTAGHIPYAYSDFTDEMAQKVDVSIYSHYSLGGTKREIVPESVRNEPLACLRNEDDFLKASYDITQKSMADFITSKRNYDDLAYFNNVAVIKLHRIVMEALREMDSDLHYLKLAIDIMNDAAPDEQHGIVSYYEYYGILQPQIIQLCKNARSHKDDLPPEYVDKVRSIIKSTEFTNEFDKSHIDYLNYEKWFSGNNESDADHLKALNDLNLKERISNANWNMQDIVNDFIYGFIMPYFHNI